MGHNGSGNGHLNGNGNGTCVGANLAYTKFLFVVARQEDDAAGARLRTAGSNIARGFFNDFDIDDSRESQAQPFETIQFFVRDGNLPEPAPACVGPRIHGARYLTQVCSKYRPRLDDIEDELRRRLGESADVVALSGAARNPRYSSAEMVQYSYKNAPARRSGRVARNAIVMPVRKTPEWWQMSALERHTYFYPHVDRASGCPVKGHAQAAQAGIGALFRRMYHNPDGYQQPDTFDFITYFECEDAALPVFDEVLDSLRDPLQNPEWRFVQEGPLWRGRRVLRW